MLRAVASLGAAEVTSILEEQGQVEVRGCCGCANCAHPEQG
jgi:redox-regulated HSP33 family molecular chaperone